MPGPQSWSVDAASNDTSDPNIFLAEGQSPPTLNNAVRAVMAGVRKLLLDTTGGLVANGGASNALVVGSSQGFLPADLNASFELMFSMYAANTGPVTLNVDGIGAKPLRRRGGIELAPGDLQPNGVLYTAVWLPFLAAYTLISPQVAVPGTIEAFATPGAVPNGWVPCDGRLLSRTSYAALFAAIGQTFGAGDGATTFAVPDLRGRAPFGADAGANRLTGAAGVAGTVGASGGAEAVALSLAQMPAHDHGAATGAGGGSGAGTTSAAGDVAATTTGNAGGHGHIGSTDTAGSHTHSGSASTVPDHTHGSPTASSKYGTAGSGSTNTGFWNAADTTVNSAPAGGHGHSLSIDAVAGHVHGVTTNTVVDHNHSVPAVPAHTHAIPAIAAHTHAIVAAGSGQAHPNMPPALVVVFAIKA